MVIDQAISIYIHFPWCIKKCYYCDFNSYALNIDQSEAAAKYLNKISADLAHSFQEILPAYQKSKLLSIFFGGGTPSLLSGSEIAKILEQINRQFVFTKDLEITLEVNPGTIEQDSIKNYKLAGINRISLGVQSFQDDKLKILGRIHTVNEVKKTIEQIICANFNSFNLDLMYGLPEQNLADPLYDLNMALSFEPTHLSWYQLTLEPNTLFYVKPPNCPNEDLMLAIEKEGLNILQKSKYLNYEVSAFAKGSNYCCKHNLNYWKYGDYLGVGPGAHSKISKFKIDNSSAKISEIIRLVKIKTPKKYLACTNNEFIMSKKILSKQEIIFEFMLNNLRLLEGFSELDFFGKTGYTFEDIAKPLQTAISKNLIKPSNELMIPTSLGRRFLNNLQELFLE